MARFAERWLGQTWLAKLKNHVGQTDTGLAELALVVGQEAGLAKVTRWMGKTRMERYAVRGLGKEV